MTENAGDHAMPASEAPEPSLDGVAPPTDAVEPLVASTEPIVDATEPVAASWQRRVITRGRTLRQHTARGTIINAAFLIALSSLGLLKGFVVAAFLSRGDYGIWGILVVGLATLSWLKGSAIGDKFVQQGEDDQ